MRKDRKESGRFEIPFPSGYGPVSCCWARLTGEGEGGSIERQIQFSGISAKPAERPLRAEKYSSRQQGKDEAIRF